jgi:nitroimidazol reductase NimA-like FMN-containing flavoprotein (pyridoxamine 5'-phosphate oxidase superfamily)
MSERNDVVWIDDLDDGVCWRLIGSCRVGRIGFTSRGEPVVLPVNYVVDDGTIVFRTAQTSMLEALGGGAAIAFELDGSDTFAETGWSVLVRGRAAEVTDERLRAELDGLPLHPWAPGARDRWIRIRPTAVTGRAISRKGAPPGGARQPSVSPARG